MTRRIATTAVLLALILTGLLAPSVGAAAPPKPTSMAATGDSITRAFNLCFFPFSDCPARSWSTGNYSTVKSHASRLGITGNAANDAVSGAKMTDLPGQATTVFNRNVGYVTVLMGGNDVCTDSEGLMTRPAAYEADFRTAMNTLAADTTPPFVYVVSTPSVKMLWEILKDNLSARSAWNSYNICQSLMANPLSTDQADVDRRERVKQRNMELNQRLRAACAAYSFCRFDGEAAFGTAFVANDVSTRDYFHPSTAGQTKIASVSYDHGYWGTKAVNDAPTAAFTHTCTGLTCTFTDASSDLQGIGGRSWHFGDSRTSVASSFTHAYAAAGTYTVTFHAIDNFGATASVTKSISVTADGGGAEPTTGSIRGKVTNASTLEPISGATVTISGMTASTSTDSNGDYQISGLPAETYTVMVEAAGFDSQSRDGVTVVAGDTTVADFALQPSATTEPSKMWIESLAAIGTTVNRNLWRADVSISVFSSEGGVAGATVSGTFLPGGTKSCTTNTNGTCTLSSDSLRNKVDSVTFTVDTVTLTSFTYDATLNKATSVPVPRPT